MFVLLAVGWLLCFICNCLVGVVIETEGKGSIGMSSSWNYIIDFTDCSVDE